MIGVFYVRRHQPKNGSTCWRGVVMQPESYCPRQEEQRRDLGPSVWTPWFLRHEENSLEGLGGQDSWWHAETPRTGKLKSFLFVAHTLCNHLSCYLLNIFKPACFTKDFLMWKHSLNIIIKSVEKVEFALQECVCVKSKLGLETCVFLGSAAYQRTVSPLAIAADFL